MRIINDYHEKESDFVFDEKIMSKEHYDRIRAVREMYAFLYEKGILKEVSFEYRDYSDETIFALDAENLEPYRNEMINSGTYKAELAVKYIFDAKFTPCRFCGGLTLSQPMLTYRDNCGCIGRSWECDLCEYLNVDDLSKISRIKRKKGSKAAVSALWKLIKWEDEDNFKEVV